jgi:WD40 repeat protein
MPSRGGLVSEFQTGGSVIKTFRSKSQIMLFNVDKPGTMILYDLKMNQPVFQSNIHQEEITSVAITESETTLVAGFRDGYIKIFNLNKEFEVRESYQAFS